MKMKEMMKLRSGEADVVWESFKEDYGECKYVISSELRMCDKSSPVFEQLPLSLHRNFALLYELDKQAQGE